MAQTQAEVERSKKLPYRPPASAHVGKVRLAVSNLERSAAFDSRVTGLPVPGQ